MPDGATPLSEEDMAGLIPRYLSTRADLNLVEAENIARARLTFLRQRVKFVNLEYLLDDLNLRSIHKRMYCDVWSWAGTYRTRVTNIGVLPGEVPMQVRELCLNGQEIAKHLDKSDAKACDEFALRFHWNLVAIHPFPNGNGRHARMVADLLAQALGRPTFPWASSNLISADDNRNAYISALRHADETLGDVEPLLLVARQQNGHSARS